MIIPFKRFHGIAGIIAGYAVFFVAKTIDSLKKLV